ncbi:sulfatase [Thermostilla marina]
MLHVLAALLAAAGVWFPTIAVSAAERVNVIFILADDLGWAELGCYGNTFNETPNLDRMAREGMRFTQAYAAAPVCSPTRAAFMTGQVPARVGITDYLRPNDPKHLPTELTTVAEAFQAAGYTTGMIGKWHLTGYEHHGAVEIRPQAHGFQEVLVSERRGIAGGSYFWPYHFNPAIKKRLPDEHLIDRMNLEAVEFIDRHHDEPFFLYVPHYAVHTRLVGRPDLVEKYEKKLADFPDATERKRNPHLAAQLQLIDEGVGMIYERLRRYGIDDKTLVVFTSDNGGEDRVTSNAPLRAGKSTLYEGGVREPMIVRLPGYVPAGTTCDAPVSTIDFFPTFAEICGLEIPDSQPIDGISLRSVWENPRAELPDRPLWWHYPLEKPHFLGGRSAGSIRHGDWKLIQFFDTGEIELYNLADDIGETRNLADTHPEIVKRLLAELDRLRRNAGAETPPVKQAP